MLLGQAQYLALCAIIMVCTSVAMPSEPATAVSKSNWLLSPLDPTDVLEIDHAEHATMVVGRESRNRTVVLACYAKNDTGTFGQLC